MGDYEDYTEVNLLWDPVAMKWARPKPSNGFSHLYENDEGSRDHGIVSEDIDNDLLNTLHSAGVDITGLLNNINEDENKFADQFQFGEHAIHGDGFNSGYDRSVIDDYAVNGFRNSNGYSRNHTAANYHLRNIQPTFKYKVPVHRKRKVKRNIDKICMIYYIGISLTVLCVSQFLILPVVYDGSPLTLRYRTWFSWFVFYHILINYVLVYIYSGPYEPSSQNFGDPGLPQSGWDRCDECEQSKPPRAHHCVFCDKCVLKRDHHCFFTGSCIGFHNQRHFIVMCFYCGVGATYAFYLLWQYFCLEYYFPISSDFWHFVLPATIVEWLVGRSSFAFVLLVVLLYLTATTAGGAIFMFIWQMYLTFSGITTHEFTKGIKTYRGAPFREKIQNVFGPWFLVQFILPMPLIGIKGDGMNWTHVTKRI